MQNKKSMSQTIKSVSDAVESVLGYQPSATQVVQTIEAIEVLVGANKAALSDNDVYEQFKAADVAYKAADDAYSDAFHDRVASRAAYKAAKTAVDAYEEANAAAQPVLEERKTFIVKPKAKKPKAKKINGYNSWKRYNAWFDSILDGDVHVLTYSHLKNQVPSATRINRPSWANRLRTEAMKRGYASASVLFDDKTGHITIQAVK